jgi:hypothetical protein
MHCLAKANNHIDSAVNDCPHLDLPSSHGINFTDVVNELFTAIHSQYPSFVLTLEAQGFLAHLTMLVFGPGTTSFVDVGSDVSYPILHQLL